MDFFLDLQQYSDWGLLALRVVLGVIFLVHGKMKWAMWKAQPSEQMPSGRLNLMRLLSIVEPLTGLALILGLWTPLAAIAVGLIMLGAIYFKISKWKTPFMTQTATGWEFDLLILISVIALLFLGAGDLSVDVRYF